MSVLENKLVPVDYDGNGTFDLGFFRFEVILGIPNGELGAWLLSPGTGLPSAQAIVNGPFIYALGNLSIPGDGFIPGFGPSLDFLGRVGAFFYAPDFNGDGKTDQGFGSEDDFTLVTPPNLPAHYELATWFMDGTGVTFQGFVRDSQGDKAIVDVSQGWASPELYLAIGGQGPLADLNGDDTSDILFLRPSPTVTGETEFGVWIIENGVATTQQILTERAGVGWGLVNTNDLDGNGTTDLIFSQGPASSLTAVGFWTMNGVQVTDQVPVGITGTGWGIVDTNDFDGNGTADIAFQNSTTQEVGIWTMDGTQVTGQAVVGTVVGDWALIDHNDFNGDGKADLLFKQERDALGDLYGVWLLDGTNAPLLQGVIQASGLDAVAQDGWEFVASGDTNSDDRADLIFYNTSTGEVGSWLMVGVVTVQQQVIGTSNLAAGWNAPFVQDVDVTSIYSQPT